MSNLSVILAAQLQVVDATTTPNSVIVQRSLGNPTLAATVSFYEPFFQANNVGSAVTLPAATVWVVYVKNLDAAVNLTVHFTPSGGATESCVLVPGGVFIYFQPTEGAGGITALTLTAAAGTVAACVLVAQ